MNVFWSYFLPIVLAGMVIGAVAATLGFRRKSLRPALIAGAGLCLVAAGIWHGPLGAAGHFSSSVERSARQALIDWEMPQVTAHLHQGPLSRQLMLAGPADDFQRSELARIMSALPGVGNAGWTDRTGGLPLIAEAALAALLGFLVGALLAYLLELHRRHNAQWNW